MASSIATLLCEQQIQLELRAQNAAETIRAVGDLLRANPAVLDADQLCADILAREQTSSTALSRGFAMPHARTKAVREIVLAVGRSRTGVPFGPGAPAVRLVFLIGTPPEMITQYLGVVGALARLLKDDAVRQRLLDAETPEEFINIVG